MIIKIEQSGQAWIARVGAQGGWKRFFGKSRAEALGQLVMHYHTRELPDGGFAAMTLDTRFEDGTVEIDYADGSWEIKYSTGEYYQRGRG